MSMSNTSKTVFEDPTIQNSSRTVFRIADVPHANLRLADLGVYDTQVIAGTGLYYPSILGCIVSAKRLSLYTGGTLIDQVQELPAYASMKHLRTTNRGSEDINRFELLNGMGLALTNQKRDSDGSIIEKGDSWTLMSEYKDYRQQYTNTLVTPGGQRHNNQFQIAGAALDKTSGMIDLKDYLPFLQSTEILDLPDLTLVIDWNLTATDYYQDTNAVTSVATPSYLPIRPTLIMEEVMGLPPRPSTVVIPYMQSIVERFVVPVAADTTVVQSTFRSGAFRNRLVKDLSLFNKVTDNANWLRAKERSPAMKGEKIQLVVNGSKYLPDQGIDQAAQKYRYWNDTHGPLNLPLAAGLEGLVDTYGNVFSIVDGGTEALSSVQLVKNYSVTAVKVNDIIERLDIEYQRTGAGVGDQSKAFDLLCFATCANRLELKNGNVRLDY